MDVQLGGMLRYKTNYKIDFDSLPHRGKSGKFLKWDDMIGKKVNFLDSDNKEDYFLITNIVPNPTKNRLKIYTDYHGYNSHITQGNFFVITNICCNWKEKIWI